MPLFKNRPAYSLHSLHDFPRKQESRLNSSALVTVWRVVIASGVYIDMLTRQIILSYRCSLACKNDTTVQIGIKSVPSLTDQTHIILTHCRPIPARLSRNSYIYHILDESDNMCLLNIHKIITTRSLALLYFISLEVGTAAIEIGLFCVMIPSLVDLPGFRLI